MADNNKEVLQRWFDEVWNQKSEAAIDKMFHPLAKSHGFPDMDSVLVGPEAFKPVYRSFCGAFPDLHVELEDVVSEGDRAAGRFKVSMTHQGDHLGFPATGKKTMLAGSVFAIIKDGYIMEGWNYMNLGAFLEKLQAAD
jgi:predicted ester cyclase